jgi:hypothetical protein
MERHQVSMHTACQHAVLAAPILEGWCPSEKSGAVRWPRWESWDLHRGLCTRGPPAGSRGAPLGHLMYTVAAGD